MALPAVARPGNQNEFTVGPEHGRYWHAAARDWVLDPAVFDVYVGGDSTAALTTTFEVRFPDGAPGGSH